MKQRGAYRPPPLVGRQPELAAVRDALEGVAAGRGGCLFVLGEAGAGKTRLLQEARAMATRRGMAVLAGRAPDLVPSPAFGLLAEALRSWFRSHPLPESDLRPFAPGLRQVLPEWPDAGAIVDFSPSQLRLLILEGTYRLLLRAAQDHGALLVLDDLQGADIETLDFVRHAAANLGQERVVVLGAVRVPEGQAAEEQVHTIARQGHAALLDLDMLAPTEVRSLVEAIVEGPAPDQLIDDLMAWTDGNPLLVEELVLAHQALGTLRREGTVVHWSGGGRALVPRTVGDIVRARLIRLPVEVRRTVEAIAILGHIDSDLLAAMTGLDVALISTLLGQAFEAGFLASDGRELRLRHALIVRAVVDAMNPVERQTLRRRVAVAIETRKADDPGWLGVLAHQYEALDDRDRAAEAYVRLGYHDLAVHGPVSAETALRRALMLARATDVADQARNALAATLGILGRHDEALRLDAEVAARRGDRPEQLARMARNAIFAGRLDDVDDLVGRAAAAGADWASLDVLRALAALWRGDLHAAISFGAHGHASSAARGDAATTCAALDVIGRASDALGHRDEARRAFQEAVGVASKAGLSMARLQALLELANLDFLAQGSAEGLWEVRRLAQDAEAAATVVLADLSLTWWLLGKARIDDAIARSDEAVELCRRFQLDLLPHALEAAGWAYNARSCGRGDALLTEGESLAPDDFDVRITAESCRGDSALRAGDYATAIEHFDRCLAAMRAAPGSATSDTGPFVRIAALAAIGRHDEAWVAVAEARELSSFSRLFVCQTWLEVGQALLDRSPEQLECALAGFREVPLFRAMALSLGAEVLRGAWAGPWLSEALRIFEQAGAETDRARVRAQLRRLGLPVPRARRVDSNLPAELQGKGITPREREVLELIAQGQSNAEIANRLFLSVRTVESHVSSLLGKLELGGRAALIVAGLTLTSAVDRVSG